MIRLANTTRAVLAVTLALFGLGLIGTPAQAIQPKAWVHTTEADFEPGQNEHTVVTNLGDVKLATRSQVVADLAEQAGVIFDLQALPDGALYIAAGPEAKLLVRRDGQVEQVLTLPGEQIFSLDLFEGRLLLGVSGEDTSRLAVLEGDELTTLVELPEVRYVWDMIVDRRVVYAATGTDGKLLRIDLGADEPAITTLLDAAQDNLLCLARDGQGNLYTGTDGDGLIFRVRVNAEGQGEPFVLFDAPEPEIGALYVLADGTLFAGTADAEQARPGRLVEAATAEAGRPEGPPPAAERPAAPPEDGEVDPGDLPQVPPRAPPIGEAEEDAGPVPPGPRPETEADEAAQPQGAIDPLWREIGQRQQAEPQPAQSAPEAGDTAGDRPVTATSEQYDALRSEIRRRLEAARRTGTLQTQPRAAVRRTPVRPAAAAAARTRAGAPAPRDGNAIYRISPNGFITEVFRESVMILRIVGHNDKLLVATGNEGQLFLVDPAGDETTIVADLEPQQAPALLVAPDGSLLLGTANPASLVRLDEGFAQAGAYTGPILDAAQISLWGRLKVTGRVPPQTSVVVETRSGNVQDPEQAAWAAWQEAGRLEHDPDAIPLQPRELSVVSPPARFMQYRLRLAGDTQTTPVVERVELAYVTPNMRPSVRSIQATPAGEGRGGPRGGGAAAAPEASPVINIEWEASDPNEDRLLYKLEYQPAGSQRWLLLAEDLENNSYEWQTNRVPDGRYILRVTASDSPDNPPAMAMTATRRSEPVLVDNTPPQIVDLRTTLEDGKLTITGVARDRLSPIRAVQYALDGAERFEPILPDDLIFDSTEEAFTITIPGLSPGPHVVTIRATDSRGNSRLESVIIEDEQAGAN